MAGKILIVDDVSTNRIVLKVKLAAAFYETIQAGSGREGLELARRLRPDLVLLDVNLPDMDGIEVCAALKTDPLTRTIPVVMVTAARDDMRRIRALRAGAEDVFLKPYSDAVLMARLRSVLRAREAEEELGLRHITYREHGLAEAGTVFTPQSFIALIAAGAAEARAWKATLAAATTDRIEIIDTETALAWEPSRAAPDVFVIAATLSEPGDGLRLMAELRSRPETRHAAICIMLPPEAETTAALALDMGANDLIEHDADPREMAIRVRAQAGRKRQSDRLRATVADGLRLAMTDALTGLHNRRYALPHLQRIATAARASGRQFAVMLLDLDRFKAINDTHGHPAGDAVLTEVAHRLRQNLRAVDLIARMGGEEFLVALPDTTPAAAERTAERLRRIISERPVRTRAGVDIPVTVSVGLVVECGSDGAPAVDELVERADRALLSAKRDGRNQVTVARSAA